MRRALVSTILAFLIAPPAAHTQSLGDVAAREQARRKTVTTPARVITGDDIKPAEPVSSPTEIPAFPSDTATADPAARRVLVTPARLAGGGMPPIPVMAVSGGEVYLDVEVTRDGGVGVVSAFRVTPPFTEALAGAVKGWRFQPAQDAVAPAPGGRIDDATKRPVATHVLVVGLFRPPSLNAPTLGEAPKNVGTPSDAVAAPTAPPTMPPYPPQALYNGVVLVELTLKADGQVAGAKVLRGAAPFDGLAMEAVSSMGFRPPRVHGQAAPTNVYVAVAFRQPVQ